MPSAIGEEALELKRQYQRLLAEQHARMQALIAALTGKIEPNQ